MPRVPRTGPRRRVGFGSPKPGERRRGWTARLPPSRARVVDRARDSIERDPKTNRRARVFVPGDARGGVAGRVVVGGFRRGGSRARVARRRRTRVDGRFPGNARRNTEKRRFRRFDSEPRLFARDATRRGDSHADVFGGTHRAPRRRAGRRVFLPRGRRARRRLRRRHARHVACSRRPARTHVDAPKGDVRRRQGRPLALAVVDGGGVGKKSDSRAARPTLAAALTARTNHQNASNASNVSNVSNVSVVAGVIAEDGRVVLGGDLGVSNPTAACAATAASSSSAPRTVPFARGRSRRDEPRATRGVCEAPR